MIQPGLERIGQLLKNVQFSWKAIHVAGTNGKGSICHHASMLLTRRTIKCGKFTSPHLVDRWDCITINEQPVDAGEFRKVEKHYVELSLRENINASPFEILTATAFHLFNDHKIRIGIIEVGMGGKLDATNILDNQAVSVISKIARDHQAYLGYTLDDIALHKAGILRPNVPYIVNPLNEWNVQNVIEQYAKGIGAGPRITADTLELREELFSRKDWHRFADPLLPFQRDNAVLALLAVRHASKCIKESFGLTTIAEMLFKTKNRRNKGRLEYVRVPPIFGGKHDSGRHIIVDGAHNPDAAKELAHFVKVNKRYNSVFYKRSNGDKGWPVTWVLAMTEGKDAHEYCRTLIKPGDNVITTTFGPVDGMPFVKPMDPQKLFDIAKSVQSDITGFAMPMDGTLRALCAAKYLTDKGLPIVLTGSLYLVGDFHRELQGRTTAGWWSDEEYYEDQQLFKAIHNEERDRVNNMFGRLAPDPFLLTMGRPESSIETSIAPSTVSPQWVQEESEREKRRKIQEEIEALDRELELLNSEEKPVSSPLSPDSDSSEYANLSSQRNYLANIRKISSSALNTSLKPDTRPQSEPFPFFNESSRIKSPTEIISKPETRPRSDPFPFFKEYSRIESPNNNTQRQKPSANEFVIRKHIVYNDKLSAKVDENERDFKIRKHA